MQATEETNTIHTPLWRTDDPVIDAAGAVVKGGMFQHQRDWWNLPNFIRMFVTGYGGGKTLQLCKRMIAMTLENAPCLCVIVSPTYPMAEETVISTLIEILSAKEQLINSVEGAGAFRWRMLKKHPINFMIYYHGRNGKLLVYSGEDPIKLKGPNVAAVGIDEPFIQDEEVFTQMIARTRHPKARRIEINLTGCVARDTLVLTSHGFAEIGSLDPGTKPKKYTRIQEQVYGDQGFRLATKFYNNGTDDAVRLTLSKGYELICTPDHPVLTMGDNLEPVYKRVGDRTGKYGHLEQLDPDTDRVAVARGMEVWGDESPSGMTNDDAYGLGMWIAEGSIEHKNYRFTITCGDKTVLTHFKEKGLFCKKFRHISNRLDQVRVNCKALYLQFDRLSMPLVRAPKKWIPAWVMGGGTREHALHFLAGMYDGDGHVCKDGDGGIGYTTTSRRMARQLHVLLTNLGVCAQIAETLTPPNGRVKVFSRRWQIVALGQNAKKLSKILPLRIPRKKKALKLYQREYRDRDCIPNAGEIILNLWSRRAKQRWRTNPDRLPLGQRICESIRQNDGRHVSYTYVRSFCALWRLNEPVVPKEIHDLEALVDRGYFWAEVRSIETGIVEDSVDFVIPMSHSFTAGGILSLQTPETLNWGYELAEGDARESHDVGIVQASTRANLALSEQYADRLSGALDEKAQLAYIGGQFVNLSRGLVYYGFDKENNIVDLPIPQDHALGAGMDFNVDPMASAVFWRTGNHIHFFDEIELANSDTEEMCAELKERYWESGLRQIYPDPFSGRATNAPGGKTDYAYIEEAGFEVNRFPAGQPLRRDRFNAANGRLKPTKEGRVRMTVAPKCKKLIKYFQLLAHELLNKKAQKDMTHLLDAATYPVAYLFPVDRKQFVMKRIRGT